MTIPAFPDIEIALLAILGPAYPGVKFVTKLPDQISATTVRIRRISGANRSIRVDRPIVDIDVFAASQATASSVARNIQSTLLSIRNGIVLTGVVLQATTINGPRQLPEVNPNLVRYGSTYEIFSHA